MQARSYTVADQSSLCRMNPHLKKTNVYPLVISIDHFPIHVDFQMPSLITGGYQKVCIRPLETAPLKSLWSNLSMPLKPWDFYVL